MHKSVALLLPVLAACQPLTDPCYTFSENAPDRCVGEIVVDASDAAAPVFSVENTGPVVPNFLSILEVDPEFPCGGGVGIWEVKAFEPASLPLTYGAATSGKVWVNEYLSPSGATIPLREGQLYEASLWAKDRIDGSGAAPATWSAVFVAGDPASVMLTQDFCDGA